MSNDPFQEERKRVTALDAARHYGLEVDRHSKALCPVHPDKHPSMTFKGSRYRCWVRDALGDAVDLVRGLYGGTLYGCPTARQSGFWAGATARRGKRAEAQERQRARELHQQFEQWREITITNLNLELSRKV